MKGKALPGTNTKAQPPVSAAGGLPGESGRFPEESRAADVPQPPLKVPNCWGAGLTDGGGLCVCGEVYVSMGKSASCARQFMEDAKKGEYCMVNVVRPTVHRV